MMLLRCLQVSLYDYGGLEACCPGSLMSLSSFLPPYSRPPALVLPSRLPLIHPTLPSLPPLTIDNEHLYDFGVWDIHGISYDRWSINFFVSWGHEIIAARPFPEDDEQHLSADYPKSIRKRKNPFPRREFLCLQIPAIVML